MFWYLYSRMSKLTTFSLRGWAGFTLGRINECIWTGQLGIQPSASNHDPHYASIDQPHVSTRSLSELA